MLCTSSWLRTPQAVRSPVLREKSGRWRAWEDRGVALAPLCPSTSRSPGGEQSYALTYGYVQIPPSPRAKSKAKKPRAAMYKLPPLSLQKVKPKSNVRLRSPLLQPFP